MISRAWRDYRWLLSVASVTLIMANRYIYRFAATRRANETTIVRMVDPLEQMATDQNAGFILVEKVGQISRW
jgi:hypothetical protein